MVPEPPIITCASWGASPARGRIQLAGRPLRALVHHTDGHHREVAGPADESRAEAVRYVRDIQAFHMGPSRGWMDTGQNFTITRNGLIFEGRHGSLAALRLGRMVVSAHCPGENDQPGVEHEHVPGEALTDAQARASVWLYAWIVDRCGMRPTQLYGHRAFYATSCPDNLPVLWLRGQVADALNHYGRGTPAGFTAWLHRVTRGKVLR
jgi:hypothetical protein